MNTISTQPPKNENHNKPTPSKPNNSTVSESLFDSLNRDFARVIGIDFNLAGERK